MPRPERKATCHPDRKHVSKGLCESCWNRREWKRNGRARRFRYRYGIEAPDYEAMVVAQGNRCAICDRVPSDVPGAKLVLCLDHNHRTGQIRGLLCDQCNRAIGQMQDDPDRLERAAQYLRTRGHG